MTGHVTCVPSRETLSYKDCLIAHLYSEDSEWNMLETVGKGVVELSTSKQRTVIKDEDKAKCRKELMKVRGGGREGGR